MTRVLWSVGVVGLLGGHAAFGLDGDSGESTPDFGPNVVVVDPSTKDVQAKADAIYKTQERSQFGGERYTILMKPGAYHADIKVGYYTEVAGLGALPDDVVVSGSINSDARARRGNATVNFWRSIENLAVTPTKKEPLLWAVSQGTALRRVHFRGDLNLSDHGWSSGGFIADSVIEGTVDSGTQQQWISRNTSWGAWKGASWNMVFVGVPKTPAGDWKKDHYSDIQQTPEKQEKPYLYMDKQGAYFVKVPAYERSGSSGVTWSHGETPGESLPLSTFYIAKAEMDTAETMNAALKAGKNLLITPGVYPLKAALEVSRAGTVVMGMGFATLTATDGNAAITIGDVGGVSISSLILEAGAKKSGTLLKVGKTKGNGDQAKPIMIADLCCRAGGAIAGAADSFVTVNASHVIGDNWWLWRADHGKGAGWTTNPVNNGAVINGDDVTLYGLFVEHCQGFQTLWNGERGRTFFYQSEMPYDPPSKEAWSHDGREGYASYKVADHVKSHDAVGLGIYCVFYDAPIVAFTACEAPVTPGVQVRHIVTLRLNGQKESGIAHILNDKGDPVIHWQKSQLD